MNKDLIKQIWDIVNFNGNKRFRKGARKYLFTKGGKYWLYCYTREKVKLNNYWKNTVESARQIWNLLKYEPCSVYYDEKMYKYSKSKRYNKNLSKVV